MIDLMKRSRSSDLTAKEAMTRKAEEIEGKAEKRFHRNFPDNDEANMVFRNVLKDAMTEMLKLVSADKCEACGGFVVIR